LVCGAAGRPGAPEIVGERYVWHDLALAQRERLLKGKVQRSTSRAGAAPASDHQSDGLAGGTSSRNAVIIGSRTCTTPRIDM
jgi:hypothetical protein